MRKFLCLLFGLGCATVWGQNVSTAYPYVDIKAFMTVNVAVNTNANTEFKFLTIPDLENGLIKGSLFYVRVKSNKNWKLNISTPVANITPITQGITGNYPVSMLGLRKTGTTPWKTLSTSLQEISSGNRGGWGKPGNSFYLDMRAIPTLSTPSGVYSCDVYFTISPS